MPIPAANNHIRTALVNTPAIQSVQVAGTGTTKTGYVIRFKDSTSAETARNNNDWLRELGNETRMVKPRFGVVVHHVPTQGLDLERVIERAIRKITDENDLQERGFRIEDIAWLQSVGWLVGFIYPDPSQKSDMQATTTIYLNVRPYIVHSSLNELRASSGPVVAY